jgi:hypothetical protein
MPALIQWLRDIPRAAFEFGGGVVFFAVLAGRYANLLDRPGMTLGESVHDSIFVYLAVATALYILGIAALRRRRPQAHGRSARLIIDQATAAAAKRVSRDIARGDFSSVRTAVEVFTEAERLAESETDQ